MSTSRLPGTCVLPTGRLIGALRRQTYRSRRFDVLEVPKATFTAALVEHRRRLEPRRARITGDLHEILHLLDDGLDSTMSETTASTAPVAGTEAGPDERALAIRLFNGVWEFLERTERTTADDDTMLHGARIGYHWGRVGKPEHRARVNGVRLRAYGVPRSGRAEPSTTRNVPRALAWTTASVTGTWRSHTRRWPVRMPSPVTPRAPSRRPPRCGHRDPGCSGATRDGSAPWGVGSWVPAGRGCLHLSPMYRLVHAIRTSNRGGGALAVPIRVPAGRGRSSTERLDAAS